MTIITRRRPHKRTDAYGDQVNDVTFDELLIDSAKLDKLAFAPLKIRHASDIDGRDMTIERPSLYVRPWADIVAFDELLINGNWYQADGVPQDWHSGEDGSQVGMVVELKRING